MAEDVLPIPNSEMSSDEKGALLLQYVAMRHPVARKRTRQAAPDLFWERLNFHGVKLPGASLFKAHLERAELPGADLNGADLLGAHLEGANLREANLQDAYMRLICLQGADLVGARLERANLAGARLKGARLLEARLDHARLREAHLEGADLLGARLRHAELLSARLEQADLRRARLHQADLRGAHLERANLSKATIAGANFMGAYLQGANLYDTAGTPCDRRGAMLSAETIRKSQWGAAEVLDWLRAGADLPEEEIAQLPVEMRDRLWKTKEGLTLFFTRPLTRRDRFILSAILVSFQKLIRRETDGEIIESTDQDGGTLIRLTATRQEDLVLYAQILHAQLWRNRIIAPVVIDPELMTAAMLARLDRLAARIDPGKTEWWVRHADGQVVQQDLFDLMPVVIDLIRRGELGRFSINPPYHIDNARSVSLIEQIRQLQVIVAHLLDEPEQQWLEDAAQAVEGGGRAPTPPDRLVAQLLQTANRLGLRLMSAYLRSLQ
ncbi:MAG: pentapeptide repeat-containing protein [Myxococcota bacterium]